MIINSKTSAVQLEEGESFVEEHQDDANIWRIGTYKLVSGATVTVERHFSQIRTVRLPDGTPLRAELNRETGRVEPVEDQVSTYWADQRYDDAVFDQDKEQ